MTSEQNPGTNLGLLAQTQNVLVFWGVRHIPGFKISPYLYPIVLVRKLLTSLLISNMHMIFWNQINVEPASSQKVDCEYFILLITKIWFIRCYVSLAKVDKCRLVNILVFWFSKWRNTRFTWYKNFKVAWAVTEEKVCFRKLRYETWDLDWTGLILG